jgi:hypothetical protein
MNWTLGAQVCGTIAAFPIPTESEKENLKIDGLWANI